jgi:Enterobacterial TraT complement resistance protein
MIMPMPRRAFLATATAALVAACQRTNRADMVVDSQTNRMYGMRSDGVPVFTDASLFPNRRLKLSLRNMSGDAVWDLDSTREKLYRVFLDKGYQRSDGEDFGLKVDLNVLRSQQFDNSMLTEYGFLGSAGGGLAGAAAGGLGGGSTGTGAAIGLAAGAALGAIGGYFTTDSTYVVVTEATFGVRRDSTRPRRVVTFEGSPRVEEWEERGYDAFRKTQRVMIANYGGGRTVTQKDIAEEIRDRQIRSLGSFL